MFEKIEQLKNDPFYKKYFVKFKKADYDYMKAFILELNEMQKDEAIEAIGRSAMKSNKPKYWTAIEELLSIAIKRK